MRCCVFLVLAVALHAQTFEVASVKPSTPAFGGLKGGCHGIDSKYPADQAGAPPPLGRCVITGARLSHLISIAYDFPNYSLMKEAPDWVMNGSERFNVTAKAEDANATEEQLTKMLQSLLADRFKLKFHWETRDLPGFALVTAKNGPKLQKAASDEVGLKFDGSVNPRSSSGGLPFSVAAQAHTMPMLAMLLTAYGTGPVVDQTGLTGVYDFKLSWDDTAGPSLFTALQELGLRLESRKVPMSFFFFESAERPSGN
jgi:uncharacterized protein (TIGR03435 family)